MFFSDLNYIPITKNNLSVPISMARKTPAKSSVFEHFLLSEDKKFYIKIFNHSYFF